jgi:hypothetical protein
MLLDSKSWAMSAATLLLPTLLSAEPASLTESMMPERPRTEGLSHFADTVTKNTPRGDESATMPGDPWTQDYWSWQWLPDGLIYRSYLAGVKEPRFASAFMHEKDLGWIWDIALGGRVGVLRYGDERSDRPDGWELDFEGAAFPRLDLEHDMDVVAVDYRAGVPLTYGCGPFQAKFAYYHLSSHLGDEFMLRNPGWTRINYVRDSLVLGTSYYPAESLRLYGEAAWAFRTDGGAKPWEFQFGIDFSPIAPRGGHGSPFAAINGHLYQDLDFSGHLVVETGWQWRGKSGHLMRVGLEYYAGKSDQYEFFNRYEEKVGLAMWYDF